MKFCSLALFVAAVASPFPFAEADLTKDAHNRKRGNEKVRGGGRAAVARGLKESKSKSKSKSKKGKEGGVCDNCGSQLPGYTFWGDSYLEEDFYFRWLTETSIMGSPPGAVPPNEVDDIESLIRENGLCYYVGIPPGLGSVDSPLESFACIFLTVISELIYQSETLRCLLMSLSKTTRDTICLLADITGIPNPDVLGTPILQPQEDTDDPVVTEVPEDTTRRSLSENSAVLKILERRQLNPIVGGSTGFSMNGDEMLDFFSIVAESEKGKEGEKGNMLKLFNITTDDIITRTREVLGCDTGNDCSALDEALEHDNQRKLQIRPNNDEFGGGGIIQAIASLIDTIAQSETVYSLGEKLLGLGWFSKCQQSGVDLFTCGIIYILEKTEDAIFCSDLQDCDIDTECTANQKIQTEYTSRRIARSLPNNLIDSEAGSDGLFNFLLADILAPCSSCENKCASLCWYQENYHQCDDYKRAWFLLGPDELGEFYNIELPGFLGDVLLGL